MTQNKIQEDRLRRNKLIKEFRKKYTKNELVSLGQIVASLVMQYAPDKNLEAYKWGDVLWESLITYGSVEHGHNLNETTAIFQAPLDDLPIYLGSKSNHVRIIANWRIKIGK